MVTEVGIVEISFDLQKNAVDKWTWKSMLQTLRLKFGYSDQLWRDWLKVVQTFSHKSTASEPVATELVITWSAATASTAETALSPPT